MIHLSTAYDVALSSLTNKPVNLYELYLDSGTRYYSDVDITWNGVHFLPLVKSRSEIRRFDSSITSSSSGQFTNVSVTFDNVDTTISQLLAANDIEGRELIIRQIDRDVTDDSLILFRGPMLRPSTMNETECVISGTSRLGYLQALIPGRTFTIECPWLFRGPECGYAGVGASCNKSWAQCSSYGNTDRYGGFRFMPHSGTFQYTEVQKKRFLLFFSRTVKKTVTATFNSVDDSPYDIPIPIIFGRTEIAGIPIDHEDAGSVTKTLAAFAVGPCQDIFYVRANQSLAPGGDFHLGQIGGTGTQTTSPRFPQGYPYNLLCYCAVNTPSDVAVVDPAATITAVIKGLIGFYYNPDGSQGPFGWSDNPVLCTRLLFKLSRDQGGLGWIDNWLNDAQHYVEANYCDHIINDSTNDQKIYLPNPLPDGQVPGVSYCRFQSSGTVVGPITVVDSGGGRTVSGFAGDIGTSVGMSLGGPYYDYEPGVDDDTSLSPAVVQCKRFTMNGALAQQQSPADHLFQKLLPSFRGFLTEDKEGRITINVEKPAPNTTLSGGVAAGATAIALVDGSQFAAGDLLLVGAWTANAEAVKYTGGGGLATALHYSHSGGDAVLKIAMAFDDSNLVTTARAEYPMADRQSGGGQGSYNRVTVKYVDAPAGFESREIRINDYDHQAAVGAVNNFDVDGSMIDSYFQAWRIGQFYLAKLRQLNSFVKVQTNIAASKVEIGDVIAATLPEFGLACFPFRVVETAWLPNDDVELIGQEYDLGIYDDVAPQATVGVPSVFKPITSSNGDTAVPPVPTFTADNTVPGSIRFSKVNFGGVSTNISSITEAQFGVYVAGDPTFYPMILNANITAGATSMQVYCVLGPILTNRYVVIDDEIIGVHDQTAHTGFVRTYNITRAEKGSTAAAHTAPTSGSTYFTVLEAKTYRYSFDLLFWVLGTKWLDWTATESLPSASVYFIDLLFFNSIGAGALKTNNYQTTGGGTSLVTTVFAGTGDPPRKVTANTTVLPTDTEIQVDATAGPITVTMCAATALLYQLTVRKIDGTANAVAVVAATGDDIQGSTSQALTLTRPSIIMSRDN